MIPWIIIGVLLIALIIGLIKSAANWNWVPLVTVALIFLTAVFGIYQASKLYKARGAWIYRHEVNEQLAGKAQDEFAEVLYGPADAITYGKDSVRGTNHELNRQQIFLGRVWKHGQPAVNGEQVTITLPPAADGTSLAGQLRQDMQVYVFADEGIDREGAVVQFPVYFIGTWQVVSSDPAANTVTIRPLFVTSQSAGEAAAPTRTWSLFETMPRDSRTVFLDDMGVEGDRDISVYRGALREQYLPAELMGMDPESAQYEALLDQYAFDGLSMNVIQQWIDGAPNRINELFDPPDTYRDVLLRFTGNSQPIPVDGTASPTTQGRFDNAGLANDPQLHHGSDVTLRTDQEVLVSKEYAVDGTQFPAEPIVDYYRRPLRDYPYVLQELGRLAERIREAIELMKQDIIVSQQMIDDTNAQIRFRDELLTRLESDISRRRQELAALQQHQQGLEAVIAESQGTIRTYYQQIVELRKALEPSDDALDASAGTSPEGLVQGNR